MTRPSCSNLRAISSTAALEGAHTKMCGRQQDCCWWPGKADPQSCCLSNMLLRVYNEINQLTQTDTVTKMDTMLCTWNTAFSLVSEVVWFFSAQCYWPSYHSVHLSTHELFYFKDHQEQAKHTLLLSDTSSISGTLGWALCPFLWLCQFDVSWLISL